MPKALMRFCPLDDRSLPSVTVVEAGGVLTVRGDQWANTIVVTDDGTAGAGAVTVQADGTSYTSQQAVTRIRVVGWNGPDAVEYHLTGDLTADRRVGVLLGNQDDSFVADLGGNVGAGAHLDLWIYGQNGEDTLAVGGPGGGVAADGRLRARLFGGNGRDVIGADLTGLWAGAVDVALCGGNGTDTVTAGLTAAAGSTGTVRARVFGGNGVDTLTLLTARAVAENPVSFDAAMNGGNGKDVFVSVPDVRVVDLPR